MRKEKAAGRKAAGRSPSFSVERRGTSFNGSLQFEALADDGFSAPFAVSAFGPVWYIRGKTMRKAERRLKVARRKATKRDKIASLEFTR